jgi:hypothetical protein
VFLFFVLFSCGVSTESFLIFYVLLVCSVYCNFSLAYMLSTLTQSVLTCKYVFSGVILPLQMLMSGYLVLIPTMEVW